MEDKNKQYQLDKVYRRVENIKSFYMHLAIYLTVNILFIIFWCFDSFMPKTFWPPAFFMMVAVAGFAVLAHGVYVFGAKYFLPKDWEEKQMKKLIEKDKQNNQKQ